MPHPFWTTLRVDPEPGLKLRPPGLPLSPEGARTLARVCVGWAAAGLAASLAARLTHDPVVWILAWGGGLGIVLGYLKLRQSPRDRRFETWRPMDAAVAVTGLSTIVGLFVVPIGAAFVLRLLTPFDPLTDDLDWAGLPTFHFPGYGDLGGRLHLVALVVVVLSEWVVRRGVQAPLHGVVRDRWRIVVLVAALQAGACVLWPAPVAILTVGAALFAALAVEVSQRWWAGVPILWLAVTMLFVSAAM